MITLIAAADSNNAIGQGSQLLWHLPNDFKHFKTLTTGHCIIMGRKTFETFAKPLPNRKHIVITRQPNYQAPEGVAVVSSLAEAINLALTTDPEPYIIGGGEIYAQALPLADKIELTRVHHTFAQADVFFPTIPSSEWQITSSENHSLDEKHLYSFTFETYLRKNKSIKKAAQTP